MATITREKVQEINSKASNGYKLDVQKVLYYGDKTLEKYIAMNEVDYLKITLGYKNIGGMNNAVINIDYKKSEGNFMVSTSGNFSKRIIISDLSAKTKQVKMLQELSKYLTEEFEKNMVKAYENCETKHEETDIFSAMKTTVQSVVRLEDLLTVK